jgi:NADH:ubiquinone reductase (H+-translocating)
VRARSSASIVDSIVDHRLVARRAALGFCMAVIEAPAPAPLVLAPPGAANVVIVGSGFAGLEAAKALARHPDIHVTVIDRRNYHLFQPLLYQVATAGLNPADIAVPIRAQFEGAGNVEVHLGTVEHIDLAQRWVAGGDRRIAYDYLILATGSQHSYFGHPEWEDHAPGLKTIKQATEMRRRILGAFELAENELDEARRTAYLTFIIVGGGPTGVELAGAIADLRNTVLRKEFRRIDPARARVVLVEAGPRLLGQFSEKLAQGAARDLEKLGVEILTSVKVEQIDAGGVIASGRRILATTVLWAAGVQASGIARQTDLPVDRAGRVLVCPDLSVPGHPEVFAVGDLAHVELAPGQLAPGLAPAAIQEGQAAARNIVATLQGRPREPFHYRDKGMMATIGKHRAIAQTRRIRLNGYLAWLAWLVVHIFYLVGFRNRLAVFWQWVWSYLFSKRTSRLITTPGWHMEP